MIWRRGQACGGGFLHKIAMRLRNLPTRSASKICRQEQRGGGLARAVGGGSNGAMKPVQHPQTGVQ
jgi:hypothetical protein